MDQIKLNFINQSNDVNNSNVVIFQKNIAANFDELAIAWKVIQNCGRLDNHPFMYPMEFQVSASDSYGNHTPQLTAYNGNAFEMVKDTSGDILQLCSTPTTDSNEIEIQNNLALGSVNGNCYRDGKLLAIKTNIAPGQKAVFEFTPKIYIGVNSQITEGDVIKSDILSQINTEINLFGITSADIIMTGGGNSQNSTPFQFHLQNINL